MNSRYRGTSGILSEPSFDLKCRANSRPRVGCHGFRDIVTHMRDRVVFVVLFDNASRRCRTRIGSDSCAAFVNETFSGSMSGVPPERTWIEITARKQAALSPAHFLCLRDSLRRLFNAPPMQSRFAQRCIHGTTGTTNARVLLICKRAGSRKYVRTLNFKSAWLFSKSRVTKNFLARASVSRQSRVVTVDYSKKTGNSQDTRLFGNGCA